ncbi:reverse transcriptase family protein [Tenacibaculum finnmarkense]|uniref:reverse transcriptase family protein n=1 Tax=Tenacibaculum finnmarkense TaxID=2781243 RepID=UPI0018E9DA44|nr:reverse transcriptase family protein [Tenacibaculum finnmarkense]
MNNDNKDYQVSILKEFIKIDKMEIQQKHIEKMKSLFSKMENKQDLVNLLNGVYNLLYKKNETTDNSYDPFKIVSDTKTVYFNLMFSEEEFNLKSKTKKNTYIQLSSLSYYANYSLCKKRYSQFKIKKKSGAERIINAPVEGLKIILKLLNFVLQHVYKPHKSATGFVLNKSIVDNAKKHIDSNYVYNIDLKDFFHSFDIKRVKLGFMEELFNSKTDREPLAFLLACLCTHPFEVAGEIKNVLPQGSPTSPTITNILCKTLDNRLTGLANRFGLRYTRYADDITFSSQHNVYNKEDFQKELKRIIENNQNLLINHKKTRLQKRGYKQEVTGLVVNDKVNVRKRYVKQVDKYLYLWEKYSFEKAKQIFIREYPQEKAHLRNYKPNLTNVLRGKLDFLKMVKGAEDSTYLKLKKRFDKLTGKQNPINEILDIWEKEGIEQAIKAFEIATEVNQNSIDLSKFFKNERD